MKVVVSGLTASGKTTVARALSEWFALPIVSGSELRRSFLGIPEREVKADARHFWLTSERALRADALRLREGSAERQFDEMLHERHDAGGDAVFDAWFLAWLAQKPSLRIWLEAALDVRVQRASMDLTSAGLSVDDVSDAISAKDARSRTYALRQYGFDIFSDRSPFQAVLETAGLEASAVPVAAAFVVAAYFELPPPGLSRPQQRVLRSALLKWPSELYPHLR